MTMQPGANPAGGAASLRADGHAIENLREALRGPLIVRGDPDYDIARKVYNAMIDRKPAYIVRCADVADVITAVQFARGQGLLVSVRGGGHNVTGFAVCDDGLVVDLSAMTGIRVDPHRQTVRAEGGCTWRDLDHATHAFGLATTGGMISTTGIAGLTLGGGFGYLARTFGLCCDNLISADVVTADGAFLTASATENEDLFWAIRGGGGNFGVVTSFEYRLHPLTTIFGGPVLFPIEKLAEVLRFYRDFAAAAPDEMYAFFATLIVPSGPPFPAHLQGRPACGIIVSYAGSQAQGEAAAAPIRQFGPPVLDLLGQMPYPAMQRMFDALLPPGLQNYWKGDFFTEINDQAIDAHVKYGPLVPTVQSAMHIYPFGGAVGRVAPDATAFNHRAVKFGNIIAAVYSDPADTAKNVAWVRDYTAALHPHSAGASYVNFMMDEGHERIRATYGQNYDRLADLKRKYDPTNLFRMNQNIEPATTV